MANPPKRNASEIGSDMVAALKELVRCQETFETFKNSEKIAQETVSAAAIKYQILLGEFEVAVAHEVKGGK